jgi:hypothetical protein
MKVNPNVFFYLSTCDHIYCDNCLGKLGENINFFLSFMFCLKKYILFNKTKKIAGICFMCANKCDFVRLSPNMNKQLSEKFLDLQNMAEQNTKEIFQFIELKFKEINGFMSEKAANFYRVFKFQQAHRQHLIKYYDQTVSYFYFNFFLINLNFLNFF